MANGKASKPPLATTATTATQESIAESQEPLGLLGGKVDFFGALGLELGATVRAKELVLKGIAFEYQEKLKLLAEAEKLQRGRPKKSFPNIDAQRAAAVLGANDLWRAKTGQDAPTQKAAIELAQQIDQILCSAELGRKPLFGNMTEFKSWQDSVSKGLRKLGAAGEKFLKK